MLQRKFSYGSELWVQPRQEKTSLALQITNTTEKFTLRFDD